MEQTCFYSVLGVSEDATSAEIRSAYRQLVKQWHPDMFSNNPVSAEKAKRKFQQIQEAYSVLSDDLKRAFYDEGMYESTEDTDGFYDFLDELTSLIEKQSECEQMRNTEEELQELHETFEKMFQEGWFSMDTIEQLWEMSDDLERKQSTTTKKQPPIFTLKKPKVDPQAEPVAQEKPGAEQKREEYKESLQSESYRPTNADRF